jgi:hypothetical protein
VYQSTTTTKKNLSVKQKNKQIKNPYQQLLKGEERSTKLENSS